MYGNQPAEEENIGLIDWDFYNGYKEKIVKACGSLQILRKKLAKQENDYTLKLIIIKLYCLRTT